MSVRYLGRKKRKSMMNANAQWEGDHVSRDAGDKTVL
jgi:hypothetical protein